MQHVKQFDVGNRGTVWLVKGDNVDNETDTSKNTRYVLKEIPFQGDDVAKNLANLLHESRPEGSTFHKLTVDILRGTLIHAKRIFHGDIKSENIFIDVDADGELQAKIGDLDDFIRVAESTTNKTNPNAAQLVGTVRYLSPERLRGDTNVPVSVKRNANIRSVGCTFLDLVTYQCVYFVKPKGEHLKVKKYCKNDSETGDALKKLAELRHFLENGGRPWVPPSLQPELRAFIARCLAENRAQRPTAKELLDDPWIHCDPAIRYIDGVPYEPHIIRLKHSNLLPRQVDGEYDMKNVEWNLPWSNNAHCAIRFLAHFGAPHFRIADAEELVYACPRALTPGQPIEKKYRDLILEGLETSELLVEQPLLAAMVRHMLNDDRMPAKFTARLQPVGAPFPDMGA
ncbi:uncharacterized protein LOC129595757 [Paramacrobiotus metropolitanus]|uniref:uncharacterized protein LOC129595757 n=1 Tax=Paramacrobiotus metropolitanus TaxID=2943436 RepID=UPI00244631F3|nr:uncharacterized protein LOC129595757 [Paramacrobiotus metropolitanus]